MSNISREEAFKLLKEYNKDSFHINKGNNINNWRLKCQVKKVMR